MTTLFPIVKALHMMTVMFSVLLFMVRFYWKMEGSAMSDRLWVRIVPHIVDTFLLLSGVSLVVISQQYPFTAGNGWLTEKLFAVVLYIGLGFVAFGRRPFSLRTRGFAFGGAVIMLLIIIFLATNKTVLG